MSTLDRAGTNGCSCLRCRHQSIDADRTVAARLETRRMRSNVTGTGTSSLRSYAVMLRSSVPTTRATWADVSPASLRRPGNAHPLKPLTKSLSWVLASRFRRPRTPLVGPRPAAQIATLPP